jgi:hypothetical protein
MRHIHGPSLSKLLSTQAGRGLPLDQTIRISLDVLGALDYAHRHGIVHRDVKPSNILLDEEGSAQLIDFGISVAIGDIRKTRVGTSLGTPLYMSPEQIRTPRAVDQRADVYGYGCVLYEMATGKPPFLPLGDEDPEFAIRQAHLSKEPVSPRQLNPSVPPALEKIILWSLEKAPDDRIAGCGEFRRLLQEADLKIPDPGHNEVRIPAIVWVLPLLSAVVAAGQWLSTQSSEESTLLLMLLASAVHLIALFFTIFRSWKALAGGQPALTPGKAVGFLFVPFFGLYWYPRVLLGYPAPYNKYLQARRPESPRMRLWLPVLYVLSGYIMILGAWLNPHDFSSFVPFWLFWDLLGCFYIYRVAAALKRLSKV